MKNINKNVKNIPHFMVENLMPTQPSLFAESKMSTFLVKDVGHSVIVTNKKQTN